MREKRAKVSKFLSLVLRHDPGRIGLTLDSQGWANVDELLECCNLADFDLTKELLAEVVATNDKSRFAFSDDRSRIRASQGHSLGIDLGLEPQQPPDLLWHGTATRFLESIRTRGLRPGNRQYVHLSLDQETARNVGRRHGNPVILRVETGRMHEDGFRFYLSENGVWLTGEVPTDYLPELMGVGPGDPGEQHP